MTAAPLPTTPTSPGDPASAPTLDLTVLVLAERDGLELASLLPSLRVILDRLSIAYEIVVVGWRGDRAAADGAAALGLDSIQIGGGYGDALQAGFARARGEFILTMDADLAGGADFITRLWREREAADVTIASRYVPGGRAAMGTWRNLCSRALNAAFSRGLDVPIRDVSSGFRLYRAAVLREQRIDSRDYDILQQTIVRAFAEGWRVREVPFTYQPLPGGSSHGRVLDVGRAWLKTFGQLWLLRNSILAADYDDRAHDSRIPLQRYWQRSRYRHVVDLIAGEGPVLDVGCGSSRIIASLPPGSVAVDVLHRKLRYARKFGRPLVHGSGFSLPFADASFPCVLCSQVIEHVPKTSPILDELCRVLAPGGRLVLGTPDYANWQWVYIEKLYGLVPGGYKDEHISHYTNAELRRIMAARGLTLEKERYILRGELIQAFRKA